MARIVDRLSEAAGAVLRRNSSRWEILRSIPYFEGWFHTELFLHLRQEGGASGLSVLGMDLTALSPGAGKTSLICPDLLIAVDSQYLVWLELKQFSLSRQLRNRPRTIASCKNSVKKAWRGLAGIDLKKTVDRWTEGLDQQVMSSGTEPKILKGKALSRINLLATMVLWSDEGSVAAPCEFAQIIPEVEPIEDKFSPAHPQDRLITWLVESSWPRVVA